MLRECRGLHGDLEAMGEREGQLGEVLQTAGWSQQVSHLSRRTQELQQRARTRLQSLQDAAKVTHLVTQPPGTTTLWASSLAPVLDLLYY